MTVFSQGDILIRQESSKSTEENLILYESDIAMKTFVYLYVIIYFCEMSFAILWELWYRV